MTARPPDLPGPGNTPARTLNLLLGEVQLLTRLHAQCDRLRRLLALSEEVLEAVGSDVMGVALDMHLELEKVGRAGRIKAWWDRSEPDAT